MAVVYLHTTPQEVTVIEDEVGSCLYVRALVPIYSWHSLSPTVEASMQSFNLAFIAETTAILSMTCTETTEGLRVTFFTKI